MKTTSRTLRRGSIAAALAAVLAVGLTGCVQPPVEAAPIITAATKEEIAGTDLSKLTLTERAVERLDLQAVAVTVGAGGLEVPYGALIYTSEGDTWVYTNPEPLVYIRAQVVVERIDGDTVRLSSGPAAGTKIVTVGAAELYGAEFDAAH